MTAIASSVEQMGGALATEECDHLLGLAQIPGQWLPDTSKFPAELTDLAGIVLGFNTHEQLTPEQADTLLAFGDKVITAAKLQTPNVQATPEGHFRARQGISIGECNCMAFHEITTGIFRSLELGKFAVGVWKGKNGMSGGGGHASSGLMIGDRRLAIDSFNKRAMLGRPNHEIDAAWRSAIEHGWATFMCENDQLSTEVTLNEVALAELFEVNVAALESNLVSRRGALYLPASGAVLMYSAVGIMKSGKDKHQVGQSLLHPYAAIL